MPKIYRSMLEDNGKPKVGPTATELGVRVGSEKPDIIPDAQSQVYPGQGGMSVSPSVASLPEHRQPKRLRSIFTNARGSNALVLWEHGEGSFIASPVSKELNLRPDPDDINHGFVEPQTGMSIDAYQNALAATQQDWLRVDEKLLS